MLPIHSWTSYSPRDFSNVMLFLERHMVKLIVENVEVEEIALLVDLYEANHNFFEYYNALMMHSQVPS